MRYKRASRALTVRSLTSTNSQGCAFLLVGALSASSIRRSTKASSTGSGLRRRSARCVRIASSSGMVSGGRVGIGAASVILVMGPCPLLRTGSDAIRDGLVSSGARRVLSDGSSRDLPMVPRLLPHRWHGALGCPHLPARRKILRGGLQMSWRMSLVNVMGGRSHVSHAAHVYRSHHAQTSH